MASAAYRFDLSGRDHYQTQQQQQQNQRNQGVMASLDEDDTASNEDEGQCCCHWCQNSLITCSCGGGAGTNEARYCRCNGGEKCTAYKVKQYIKMFLARLFSHVGLCALVVGYALMGAALFKFLEKENELRTRGNMANVRMNTLDKLYNITGPLRDELILQEERIQLLLEQIELLTASRKKCHHQRIRQENFLAWTIKNYQGDNVPLHPTDCFKDCLRFEVEQPVCKKLCIDVAKARAQCIYWEHEIPNTKKSDTSTTTQHSTSTSRRSIRSTTVSSDNDWFQDKFFKADFVAFSEIFGSDDHDHDVNETSSDEREDSTEPFQEFEEDNVFSLPRVRRAARAQPSESSSTSPRSSRQAYSTTGTSSSTPSLDVEVVSLNSELDPRINIPVHGDLINRIRKVGEPLGCEQLTCVMDDMRTATVCFQPVDGSEQDPTYKKVMMTDPLRERYNVLWRDRWLDHAETVLKKFEQDVIRKAKTEGYDGGDSDDDSSVQWNFSGALLYSVTVITTIGYGNIAPKTSWGRIATIIYAIFGMPLFLMWASQMGTFLAHMFKFFYVDICCIVCKRRKRRKQAAKKELAEPEKPVFVEEQLHPQLPKSVKITMESEKGVRGSSVDSTTMSTWSSVASKPKSDLAQKLIKERLGTDSGLESQQSLDKHEPPGKILDEEVKELLITCAKYNLDQGIIDYEGGYSAEVLEEIRHVEAIETIRTQNFASPQSAPDTPYHKALSRLAPQMRQLPSSSPLPLPRPFDLDEDPPVKPAMPYLPHPQPAALQEIPDDDNVIKGNLSKSHSTPQSPSSQVQSHDTIVSVQPSKSNQNPVTSLAPITPSPRGSKSPPPYSPNLDRKKRAGTDNSSAYSDREDSSVIKVSVNQKVTDNSSALQERVPILPVLIFVAAYIILGAIIFSAWESWTFLEGAYFSFITLTTIGFGDFVPGDAVLNVDSENGQAKLIIACVYLLLGLAIVAMGINLVQEEILEKIRQIAKDMGITEDDDEEGQSSS